MTLKQEIWHQDLVEQDLWVSENGLFINTAALEERTYYFDTVRVLAEPLSITEREVIDPFRGRKTRFTSTP